MIVFWLVVAMFMAGALLLLLPPLMRRPEPATADDPAAAEGELQREEAERDVAAGRLDADRLAQVQREIDARVRAEAVTAAPAAAVAPARRSALAVAVALPAAALALYLALGRPQSVVPTLDARQQQRHEVEREQIEQRAAALAERLRARPDDAEGWLMLGRSFAMLGRFRDGATALTRASALLPGNANVMADVADVLAMAQGRRFAGEPSRWIQQALDTDPRHAKALALAGTAAFEAHDYAAAVGYWKRVLEVVPPDSPAARSTQGSIAQALALERGEAPAPAMSTATARPGDPAAPATAPRNDATPAAATAITGTVEIAPALAARVAPGATLFVFARAAEGPRMPLAIVRREGPTLPASFTLDDSSAMAPAMRLSQHAAVVVGARLSRSGSATPQSGDLVGSSAVLRPGAQGLRLVIDRVEP